MPDNWSDPYISDNDSDNNNNNRIYSKSVGIAAINTQGVSQQQQQQIAL